MSACVDFDVFRAELAEYRLTRAGTERHAPQAVRVVEAAQAIADRVPDLAPVVEAFCVFLHAAYTLPPDGYLVAVRAAAVRAADDISMRVPEVVEEGE